MSSTDTVFKRLDDIPLDPCYYALPKPLNDPLNPNCIIITTDYDEVDDGGIYQYNLNTNKIHHIHQYDHSQLQPESHSHFIDSLNNVLYIFGGSYSSFGAFNLETKKMEYDKLNGYELLSNFNGFPTSVYIPSVDQIHVYHEPNCYHFQIEREINGQNTIKLLHSECVPNKTGVDFPKLVHIASINKLMILDSDINGKIWSYDLLNKHKNDDNSDWIATSLRMPQIVDDRYYDVLVAFDNIMFVFYFKYGECTDIWCLHLLYNEWFKSKYNTPDYLDSEGNIFVVKDENHMVHILDVIGSKHCKVNLYDLIPNELMKSHRKFYKLLIMGFIRKQEKNNIIPCIPIVLKTLILNFFPL